MFTKIKKAGAGSQNALKLYIIDDDIAVRESSRILCEPIELPCFTFASGEAFLGHLETDPFPAGCAIVDVCLYGMSGLAVLQQLTEHYPCIVPVLITGFAELQQIAAEIKYTKAKLVPKPYVGDAFWDVIVESLSIAGKKTMDLQSQCVPYTGLFNRPPVSQLRSNLRKQGYSMQ